MRMPDKKLHEKITKEIDKLKLPFGKLRNAAGISKNSNGEGTVRNSNGYFCKDVDHWIKEIENELICLKAFLWENEKDLIG